MRRADLGKVIASLAQAELAVHREANFRGVAVSLAVVLPPAHRAQLQGTGRIEGFVTATGATIAGCDYGTHTEMDDEWWMGITGRQSVDQRSAVNHPQCLGLG